MLAINARDDMTPEEKLLVALMEDAIATIRAGGMVEARAKSESPAQLVYEARRWIASDDDGSPFAFVAICERFGFDAGYVRRMVDAIEPASRGAGARRGRAAWRKKRLGSARVA